MAVLPIVIAPDPRLKARCEPVETVDDELRGFLDDMVETMLSADGIGLAAPQVGVLKRVIVVAAPRGEEDDDGEGRSKNPLRILYRTENSRTCERFRGFLIGPWLGSGLATS